MTPDEIRDAVNRKQAEEYAAYEYARRGGYSSSGPNYGWMKEHPVATIVWMIIGYLFCVLLTS